MPEWDDGASWPRKPRSPADAIRPPKHAHKKSGCRLSLSLMLACVVVAGLIGAQVLAIVAMGVASLSTWMGLQPDMTGPAYLGLSLLLIASRVRWLL